MHFFDGIARCLALLALAFSGATQAACLVKADAAGANSGATWVDAYTDLQSALRTSTCSEVWVAAGTYTPGVARTDSFVIRPGSAVYGGFAGSEATRTQADPAANVTVLSGDIGTVGATSDNSYHVVTMDGTTAAGSIAADTVLDGFTIRDGNANANTGLPNVIGAGVYCTGNVSGRSCSPTLANLRFIANSASYGGAIALRADGFGSASPELSDVVFSGNIATRGGGAVYIWSERNGVASPTIRRATFSSNKADQGGAIYNSSGSQGGTANAAIVNATFHGNDASLGSSIGNGGAIYNAGVGGTSAMTLTNVTFSGNTATGSNHFGGAMVNEGQGATPIITNAIFWGNEASALPELLNSLGAQPRISHSLIAGSGGSGIGWHAAFGIDGGGNLDIDPLLGELTNHGGFGQTMLPGTGSPAIDAGDDANCPSTDQRGAPRPQGAHCDLGAVEVVLPHTCYVNRMASGANDGFTWAGAYVDLQSALHEPLCSEVWVAKGVYTPTSSSADQVASFSIRPGLKVHGGFLGDETGVAQANPGAYRTVLSGDIDGNDVVDADGILRDAGQIVGNNSHSVVTVDGTTVAGPIGNDTVLDGFAITGGAGGASVSGGSITGGGGLYCRGPGTGHACNPTLARLWFSGNRATWGGALFVHGDASGSANPVVRNSLFSGNRAVDGGGAVYLRISAAMLVQSTFSGNAAEWGSAVEADGGDPRIVQSTFSNNVASDAAYSSTVMIVNAGLALEQVILWGNTGPSFYRESGTVAVSDSIVQDGCGAGITCTGLITGDPVLGPLRDNGGATMSHLPGVGGSGIDKGTTCGTAPYDVDQRGISRPQGQACDIGAVELRLAQLAVGATGPGTVTADASAGAVPASGGIAACAEDGDHCIADYAIEPSTATVVLKLESSPHAHLVSASDTCGMNGAAIGVLSGDDYTIAPLDADCVVVVEFALDTHTVGGSISGLAGSGLQLQINGAEIVTPAAADTAFQFLAALVSGAHYDVTIVTQPMQPWQTCTIANGSGAIGDADVTDIAVTCMTDTHGVGGIVNGLAADGQVSVRLNGGETLTVGNGPFAFATALASGTDYTVDIAQQPDGQRCMLKNASGTVGGADVVDVAVQCAALPAHLLLGIDDGRAFAGYGRVVDYTVTVRNDGFSTAVAVPIDASLSPAFDSAYALWQCFGGDSAAFCTASGEGPLHDIATVPPGRTLTWRVSVPVRFDSPEADATFALALGGAQTESASDTNVLVLLRDGFDVPYGDGSRIAGAQADAILSGKATHTFALPPPSSERLDDVLTVRDNAAELRVQRTALRTDIVLLRLLYRGDTGRENASEWVQASDSAELTISGLGTADGERVALLEGADTPLVLPLGPARK